MFTGFSPETVDFLWGIRLNNNREWFQSNKSNYTKYLYEPMKALGQSLSEVIADKPGELLKVSRIYRDARLHPPVPYKESLWICIRKDVQWWADNPCLYFEITPDGISYGFFFWHPQTALWERFRKEIAAEPAPFLQLIADVEEKTGVKIQAECYKRPKPCDNPDLERFFGWKGAIECTVRQEFGESTFHPELDERVKDFFEKVWPLYEYFGKYGA